MTIIGGGFNYRGLKLALAGVVAATVAGAPGLLWDGGRVLHVLAYAGVLVGFAVTAYGLALHWREFIKMDATRRNRID